MPLSLEPLWVTSEECMGQEVDMIWVEPRAPRGFQSQKVGNKLIRGMGGGGPFPAVEPSWKNASATCTPLNDLRRVHKAGGLCVQGWRLQPQENVHPFRSPRGDPGWCRGQGMEGTKRTVTFFLHLSPIGFSCCQLPIGSLSPSPGGPAPCSSPATCV